MIGFFKKTGMIFLLAGSSLFSSCIVESPKYAKVEQVLSLKTGMSKEEVSAALGIPPYDLKSLGENGESVYIYKYRVTNRHTFPLFTRPANGRNTTGKYVDLFVTYSPEGKMTKMESCSTCEETREKKKKLDINALMTFISLALPALAIYFKP